MQYQHLSLRIQVRNHYFRLTCADEIDENYPLLSYFLKKQKEMKAVKYIPVLVDYYHLFNQAFAYRITEEQSLQWTVEQCISHISKFEEKSVIQNVKKAWESMKKVWAEIADLAEMNVCRDQLEERPFEGYVFQLDEKTLFGSLVTHRVSKFRDRN